MRDLIKEDAELFLGLFNEIIRHSYLYGFEYIRTPVVEKEEIFAASLGASTDVVEKEMFHVERKEKGEKYVLRPEGTASIARAYLQNGMHSWPQPVRLFYFGPMFRYERPQAGRYREHYQWGLEVLITSR
jgi:histidyl-tRNA synthetase